MARPEADPQTLYLTMMKRVEPNDGRRRPLILRSRDAGRTFEQYDHSAVAADGWLRLLAADPIDSETIYSRVERPDGDRLVISNDGGRTVRTALTLPGSISAFLRRSDGHLMVGTIDAGAFVSSDGGRTFERWPGAPRLRGLAEREGALYALADNFKDGFAVGVSRNGGASFEPLVRFDRICGLVTCPRVASACAEPWRSLKATFGIAEEAKCSGAPRSTVADAAASPDDDPGQGCACRAVGSPSSANSASVTLLVLLGLLARTFAIPAPGRRTHSDRIRRT